MRKEKQMKTVNTLWSGEKRQKGLQRCLLGLLLLLVAVILFSDPAVFAQDQNEPYYLDQTGNVSITLSRAKIYDDIWYFSGPCWDPEHWNSQSYQGKKDIQGGIRITPPWVLDGLTRPQWDFEPEKYIHSDLGQIEGVRLGQIECWASPGVTVPPRFPNGMPIYRTKTAFDVNRTFGQIKINGTESPRYNEITFYIVIEYYDYGLTPLTVWGYTQPAGQFTLIGSIQRIHTLTWKRAVLTAHLINFDSDRDLILMTERTGLEPDGLISVPDYIREITIWASWPEGGQYGYVPVNYPGFGLCCLKQQVPCSDMQGPHHLDFDMPYWVKPDVPFSAVVRFKTEKNTIANINPDEILAPGNPNVIQPIEVSNQSGSAYEYYPPCILEPPDFTHTGDGVGMDRAPGPPHLALDENLVLRHKLCSTPQITWIAPGTFQIDNLCLHRRDGLPGDIPDYGENLYLNFKKGCPDPWDRADYNNNFNTVGYGYYDNSPYFAVTYKPEIEPVSSLSVDNGTVYVNGHVFYPYGVGGGKVDNGRLEEWSGSARGMELMPGNAFRDADWAAVRKVGDPSEYSDILDWDSQGQARIYSMAWRTGILRKIKEYRAHQIRYIPFPTFAPDDKAAWFNARYGPRAPDKKYSASDKVTWNESPFNPEKDGTPATGSCIAKYNPCPYSNPWDPASCGFQGPDRGTGYSCWNDPEFQRLIKADVQELARIYSNDEISKQTLVAIKLNNETGYSTYQESAENDNVCYCEDCTRKWHQWLSEKYSGDIDRLNKLYKLKNPDAPGLCSFQDFYQVPPPPWEKKVVDGQTTQAPYDVWDGVNTSLPISKEWRADWFEFRQHTLVEHYELLADWFKLAYGSGAPLVCATAFGWTWGLYPHGTLEPTIWRDFEQNAPHVDILGGNDGFLDSVVDKGDMDNTGTGTYTKLRKFAPSKAYWHFEVNIGGNDPIQPPYCTAECSHTEWITHGLGETFYGGTGGFTWLRPNDILDSSGGNYPPGGYPNGLGGEKWRRYKNMVECRLEDENGLRENLIKLSTQDDISAKSRIAVLLTRKYQIRYPGMDGWLFEIFDAIKSIVYNWAGYPFTYITEEELNPWLEFQGETRESKLNDFDILILPPMRATDLNFERVDTTNPNCKSSWDIIKEWLDNGRVTSCGHSSAPQRPRVAILTTGEDDYMGKNLLRGCTDDIHKDGCSGNLWEAPWSGLHMNSYLGLFENSKPENSDQYRFQDAIQALTPPFSQPWTIPTVPNDPTCGNSAYFYPLCWDPRGDGATWELAKVLLGGNEVRNYCGVDDPDFKGLIYHYVSPYGATYFENFGFQRLESFPGHCGIKGGHDTLAQAGKMFAEILTNGVSGSNGIKPTVDIRTNGVQVNLMKAFVGKMEPELPSGEHIREMVLTLHGPQDPYDDNNLPSLSAMVTVNGLRKGARYKVYELKKDPAGGCLNSPISSPMTDGNGTLRFATSFLSSQNIIERQVKIFYLS
jgi:hypothetical protein